MSTGIAVIAVVLLPLSVLLAYIRRIALVVQRTAAFGPFIPQEEQQRIEQEGSGSQRSGE